MFRLWLGLVLRCFCSRRRLLTENLALRQQLSVFKRRHPRPKLTAADRLFWLLARRLWSSWKEALILVNPETVVQWHRAGFRWYWSMLSRVRKTPGRKKISKEIRELIFKMVAENPNWGAPRVHGELLMVGFEVSERTVSRWMRRAPRDSEAAQRWRTFLHNHREAIAAVDFFAVPTVTLMSPGIQPVSGQLSNSEMPSHMPTSPDSWCSITTGNTDSKCQPRFAQ
jgi:putative transposase